MTIRPIQRAEIEVFARFSADDDLNALFKDDMMRRWEEGASRPEWCFVAEEHGQVVGCIGYWGLPAFSIPSVIEFLLLPWEGNYLEIGTALLRQTLARFHAQGVQAMKYLLPIPSRLHAHPSQRVEVLEHVGFDLQRQGDRWERTDMAAPLVVSDRLVFRPLDDVGETAFIDAIQRVTVGTLDRGLRSDRERLGPARAAREEFASAQAMRYEPTWWQLAYTHGGALVGLVMPAENDGGPIIYYIGVVPEYRGQGYVDDLLTQGTTVLQEAGATRIVADTDKVNIPMARAFERAGYRRFLTRVAYAINLARLATHP
jgi:RimJ/RimL family protein N-acetyltransferase